jgi:predicted short-subunit dehydrogenase-like oxidoreductase (DUF2520 family)
MPTIVTGSRRKSQRNRELSAKPKRLKRLRISIIGTGRLGTALGGALRRTGHRIDLVVAKHAASARRAARLIGTDAVSLSGRQLDQLSSANYERLFGSRLILIATPDDVLEPLGKHLAQIFRRQNANRANSPAVVLHTSGALSSDVLKPLRTVGFAVGSVHPLISIADRRSTEKVFEGGYFCIEGDQEAARVARTLVKDLKGHGFTIDANLKALYHAAAVMSSGHVTALFDVAIEMLTHCGLSAHQAQRVLLPLLASATTNLATNNPAGALTGTFARGDLATARKHLAAMKSADLKEAATTYVLLGQRSLKLAKTRKPGTNRRDGIARLLSQFR